MTLARVLVGLPILPEPKSVTLREQLLAAGILSRHDVRLLAVDDLLAALDAYRDPLTTMGRTIDQDTEFFLSACAAARLALQPEAGMPWPSDSSDAVRLNA